MNTLACQMFGYESEVFSWCNKIQFWPKAQIGVQIQASEPKAKEKCCEAAIIAGGKVW